MSSRLMRSWWMLATSARPPGRIAVLVTTWPHHAERSGYRSVAESLGLALPDERLRFVPAWPSQRPVDGPRERARQLAWALRVTGRDHLLVINGDFRTELIQELRQVSSARITAVFHQSPEFLESPSLRLAPGTLDGIVCVARCQLASVRALAPPGRTHFIPHGVDTAYFSPGLPKPSRPVVLCVGSHGRDFDTLRRSAEIIQRAVPGTSVRLVAPPTLLPTGLDLGPVERLSGLDDDALRSAYRDATVVLLPLTRATANNSLLEAMACGKPVVVTDVGGVRDYAAPDIGALCPRGDPSAHASAVLDLLGDTKRREVVGLAARAAAEEFSWPKVRDQVRQALLAPPAGPTQEHGAR